MKDYYKVLGISRNASQDEIKKAFYRLAHKYHPDKGGNSEKFKEINEAYQILGNKNKRDQYDKFGTSFDDSQFGAGAGAGAGGQGSPFSQGFDFSSAGEGFDSSVFEDIFENFFGGSSFGRKKQKQRGENIAVEIELSLEEVFSGAEREISIRKFVICDRCNGSGAEPGFKMKTCPSCGGTGQVKQVHQTIFGSFTKAGVCPQCQGEGKFPEKKCRKCQGEGRVKNIEKISFSVPPGMSNGETVRVPGKGEADVRKKESGDLFVRVYVREHPYFVRRGDDIYYDLEVNFSQAALGDKVDVPTLAGEVELKIPSGTQAGKLLRLKGMGIPHIRGRGKGDEYIKINVKTPKKLTREQKKIIEKLKEEGI